MSDDRAGAGHLEIVARVTELLPECHRSGRVGDELGALLAPDLRVDASHRVFNPGVYEGAEGMETLVREIRDDWEDFRETTEQIVEVGDRVIVLQTISGRGRTSGLEVQQSGALIFSLENGRVRMVEVYGNRDEALHAVGLTE